jgi:hypothetical protein
MIDLNEIAIFAKVKQLERFSRAAHAMLGFKIDQKKGTVLTMAELVPSVKFNGTITPREVREQSQTGRRPFRWVHLPSYQGFHLPFFGIPQRQGIVTEAAQHAAGDQVAAGPLDPRGSPLA